MGRASGRWESTAHRGRAQMSPVAISGTRVIQARVASDLNQREFAERSSLDEQ